VQSSDLAAQAAQAALAAQAAAPVVEAAPKVLSAEEYIAQAPAEIRDVLASSMRMHSERKKSLIETLVKHPKNQFDQAYYEGQSLEVLEKMPQFFADKPSYAGVAPANQPHLQAANPGGAGGPQYVEAPKVFEKKTAA